MRWIGAIIVIAIWFWLGFIAGAAFGRTITHDMGGSVSDRLEEMQHMTGARIEGICFSACTLYLDLPETCVTPDAILGFHSPSTASGLMLTRENWERLTRLMASHYPPQIADWFMREARYSAKIIEIRGDEAIRLGARKC